MRSIFVYTLIWTILVTWTACTDDDASIAMDSGTADAGNDTITEDHDTDGSTDTALTDTGMVDTTETPCGPNLTCTSGDVCVAVCLCCGADTGNPADEQTDYQCVTPDPACEGRPSECIDQDAVTPTITGDQCYPDGDYTCTSYCV